MVLPPGRLTRERRKLDITLAPFSLISAMPLGAKEGGKTPPHFVVPETTAEGSGETEEQIGFFRWAHTERGKQRQVLPAGPPIVFMVAVVTDMGRVAIGDPQQTATRVAKPHFPVLIAVDAC